jgi:hypothetical protein
VSYSKCAKVRLRLYCSESAQTAGRVSMIYKGVYQVQFAVEYFSTLNWVIESNLLPVLLFFYELPVCMHALHNSGNIPLPVNPSDAARAVLSTLQQWLTSMDVNLAWRDSQAILDAVNEYLHVSAHMLD